MKIKFTDTFFRSFNMLIAREKWYWKIWDFFRYDIPYGVKNIFFFWKVIWKYRSWDSSYQMRILARSLEPLAHNLEYHGTEVSVSRLKKVAKIRRAIEILNHGANDEYVQLAEEKLGYPVNTSYGMLDEPIEITQMNAKIFKVASELEEKEWAELWKIFKGQNYAHFTMFKDKSTSQNTEELWYKWFDGTGMKSWWD
jgi:hypothetical protein